MTHQPGPPRDHVLLLRINPRPVTSTLFGIILAWVFVDAMLNVAQHALGYSSLSDLTQIIDLDRERNLATWFASLLLAFAALLLLDAAWAERLRGRHFSRLTLLALVFCYLSIDEYISLHERFSAGMQLAVGAVLVLSAVLCSARWLVEIPAGIRRRILAAGAIYIGGALVMDAVGAVVFQFETGLLYAMTTTIEEGLELVGTALSIDALLRLGVERIPAWSDRSRSLPGDLGT